MRINRLIPLALAALLCSCSVAAVKKHNPNFKNVRDLERVKGSFQVAAVKAGNPEMEKRIQSEALSCRLTTFNMPADRKVADFLREALTDELDAARKLSPEGKGITLVVNNLESSTGSFDKGSWALDFDYQVQGKTLHVKTSTEFESAFAAETACRNTAEALSEALGENFAAFYRKLQK